MTSFADQAIASRTRDVVERITKGVLRRERPEPRIGKVYEYDLITQTARVLFAGDTIEDLVSVKFAKNMVPVTYMKSTYDVDGLNAPGDIVRVWGKPGGYFILDYVWGGPESAGTTAGGTTALHNNPSFESVTGTPSLPSSWTLFWGSGIPSSSTSDVFSGTRSLVIDTTNGAGTFKIASSTIFSVVQGDSVTISVWARAISGVPELDFGMQSRATGTPDFFDPNTVGQGAQYVLTPVWTKYSQTYTIPGGHTVARIFIRTNQTTSGNQAVAAYDLTGTSKVAASGQFLPSSSWVKEACDCATTANVSNLATGAPNAVDGVTILPAMRILVLNQTTQSQNGIYVVQTVGTGSNGTWARAGDAATASQLAGAMTSILGGTNYGGMTYKSMFKVTDTIGTTALVWFPIGDTNWINLQLINSWVNYDSGLSIGGTGRAARIRRINGVVYHDGTIKTGTAGTAAWNVPVGFRPRSSQIYELGGLVLCSGGIGQILYDGTTGNMLPGNLTAGTNVSAYCYMAFAPYPAEA